MEGAEIRLLVCITQSNMSRKPLGIFITWTRSYFVILCHLLWISDVKIGTASYLSMAYNRDTGRGNRGLSWGGTLVFASKV